MDVFVTSKKEVIIIVIINEDFFKSHKINQAKPTTTPPTILQ